MPLTKALSSASDNVLMWRLGEACQKAANNPKCGDYIDRGLILLRELNSLGFDIIQREEPRP